MRQKPIKLVGTFFKKRCRSGFLKKDLNHSPNLYQKEHTIWGQVPCWGSFLTSKGFSGLERTLLMSKWLPARHPSSCHLFFKFSDLNLGSNFDPFWENLTCRVIAVLLMPSLRMFSLQNSMQCIQIKKQDLSPKVNQRAWWTSAPPRSYANVERRQQRCF